MKKVGLALGGGGARGLSHIQFLKVLDDLNVSPGIISGTSIGSIIGALYASGLSGRDIEELAENISWKQVLPMFDFSLFANSGLVKGGGVMEYLEKHIPVTQFNQLDIPLKISAADFWLRKERVFEEGDLLTAIRASISIPGLFRPLQLEDGIMVDGGIVNPVPMNLIRHECDLLIAIDVSGYISPARGRKIPSIFDSVMGSLQIMESFLVEQEKEKHQPELYVKPKLININILDFHKHKAIKRDVSEDVAAFRAKLNNIANGKKGEMKKRGLMNIFRK